MVSVLYALAVWFTTVTLVPVLRAKLLKVLPASVNAKVMSCLISKETVTLVEIMKSFHLASAFALQDIAAILVEFVFFHVQPINSPSKVHAPPVL